MSDEVIPFERSYWIIPGRLLAGNYPTGENSEETTQKLTRLVSVGISHVVNLTDQSETMSLGDYGQELTTLAVQENRTVTISRNEIQDGGVPSAWLMRLILNDIDTAVLDGRAVYVHCWAGRGRTGTVVGCYLARHGLALGEQALKMLAHLRRTDPRGHLPSPENKAQRDFVRNWGRGQ